MGSVPFLPISGRASNGGVPDEEWRGKALILRAQRQALLAGNIANADTPGHKTTHIDFQEAMQIAMKRLPARPLQTTSTKHATTSAFSTPAQSTLDFTRYVIPSQASLDNNLVDMDRERAAFSKNAILHRMAIDILTDEYKEFNLAASDPRK